MAKKVASQKDATAASSSTPTISKSEAARRAIAHGVGKPIEASAYIKKTFGLDMSPQHFSAIKSTHLKNAGRITVKGRRGRKPTVSLSGHAASAGGPVKDASLLEAMEAMKPLVATLGPERVKRIVDLLG